ncbi:MAG: hypothetical protein HYR85_07395 [Planctomycetes bacterium]|nr:hypothetical protein [Planctomycetota bacterium]MBI3844038.1 hypothetical protein [Planctomycetota bacterium]
MTQVLDIDALVASYLETGAIIDDGLLVVFLAGRVDPSRMGELPRTEGFGVLDFYLLERIVTMFSPRGRHFTTPNILTEADDLGKKLNKRVDGGFRNEFVRLANALSEKSHASATLCQAGEFRMFGLADCSMMEMARKGFLVVTTDGPLCGLLRSQSLPVIHFEELRDAWRRWMS